MKNKHGNKMGNCGYNKKTKKFIPCAIEDAKCGLLHCHRFDSKKNFDANTTEIVYNMIYHGSGVIPCHSISFRRSLKGYDPLLVADGKLKKLKSVRIYIESISGTKCGDGKMCLNQKCVPIKNLYSREISQQ